MSNRYKQLEMSIRKRLNWSFLGSFNSAFTWLWVEFDSLREYIPGDSIKSIDWKTTAKLWDVHVKNYEEEKDLKVLFYIHNSEAMSFWSKKKTKLQTLEEVFFLLWQCSIAHGFNIWSYISCDTWSQFIDFKQWSTSLISTINALSPDNISVQNNATKNISLKKLWIKNTLIFVLTDNLEPDIWEIKYLNTSNEVIYINIFDNFENNLSRENFSINFSHTSWAPSSNIFSNLLNIFFDKKKNNASIKKYQDIRSTKIALLKKSLISKNIEYIRIDDTTDIFLKLYKFFMRYKRF